MRRRAPALMTIVLSLATLASAQTTQPADRIDDLFINGTIANAEAELSKMLKADPKDDHARFGLGVAQFLRGVERLLGSLNEFGFPRPNAGLGMTLGLQAANQNAEPKVVTAADVRAILTAWSENLATAEKTLADIHDPNVKFPLHFALVRLNIDRSANSEALFKLYVRLSRNSIGEDEVTNFMIAFDAADAEWLRGYCHLLMGMLDFLLAHDGGELFDRTAQVFFPRPKSPFPFLNSGDRVFDMGGVDIADVVAFVHLINLPVIEPKRMTSSLEHLQGMVACSRRMWKLALAETDNDHEWIPNPRQDCVFPGIHVTKEMVAAWQSFLDEADAILAGKKLIPFWRGNDNRGVNLRRFFTEPTRFDLVLWVQGSAAAPYLEEGQLTTKETWTRLMRVFQGDFIGFAIWFN